MSENDIVVWGLEGVSFSSVMRSHDIVVDYRAEGRNDILIRLSSFFDKLLDEKLRFVDGHASQYFLKAMCGFEDKDWRNAQYISNQAQRAV